MFSWLQKDINVAASVLFRGNWPSTKESFNFLRDRGIQISDPGLGSDGVIWSLELKHPDWGEATLLCTRDFPMPPEIIIEWDSGLTDPEKAEIKACGTAVSLMVKSRRKHLLRDRKNALFFMNAVMGEEGVAALDHVSEKFWSRAELKAETAHNADVDVQSLYSEHFVREGNDENDSWYHTHGLAAIGFNDFDILSPSKDAMLRYRDLIRSIAFAIVEGKFKSGETLELIAGYPMRAVSAGDFMAKADKRWTAIREDPENFHLPNRIVICDPPPRGLFSRFRAQVHPYSHVMGEMPDDALLHFSNDASALMAERARATYPVFRDVFEELKQFEPPSLIKLGYKIDNGGPTDKEHLWFQVHEARDNEIDATLMNQPFSIARMKEGQRAVHSIDLITDWQFFTPAGEINPRQTRALRFLREAMVKAKENGFDPNAAPSEVES